MAFARSSSSLEIFAECSFDSSLERAIADARASSSSSTGECLKSFSDLGGELVEIRDGDEKRGGGRDKGGGTVSNGEA